MPLALQVVLVIALVTAMLQTGIATPLWKLRECMRRRGELARAIVIMLILGPLTARLVAAIFALGPKPSTALVLLSVVGVVPLASRGARIARADVAFAAVLTAALGIVAAFTAAPTTRLALGYTGPIVVHTGSLIVQVVLLQVMPIAAGIYIRTVSDRAQVIERALEIFNAAMLVVLGGVAVVVLPRYGAVRSLGWNGALAAAFFSVLIAAMAYLLAGPDREERRTLASIANMPNVILAILITTGAGVGVGFALAVVGVFIVRVLVGLAIQMVLARRRSHRDVRRTASHPA